MPTKTQIYILKTAKTKAGTLDLFFFNDDPLRTLDAYQRFEGAQEAPLEGASRSGDKWVAGILNAQGDIFSWSDIQTFQRLSERMSDLTEDNPHSPVMTGVTRIRAGRDRRCTLQMTPLSTRIILNSLCVDFHARPYNDAALEDIDIYLVNVNRTIPLFDDETAAIPSSWLNMGQREPDGKAFHIDRLEGTALPRAEFYCYPNGTQEESLGSPFTRLVVEATLLGERYYYPVNLPPTGRNETLLLDLTITRTGTDDPDTPAGTDAVRLRMSIRPWEEKEPWTVLF